MNISVTLRSVPTGQPLRHILSAAIPTYLTYTFVHVSLNSKVKINSPNSQAGKECSLREKII